MSTYQQYQDARDAAWRALLQLPEKRLPVDAEALAGLLGAEVHPFPARQEERLYALVRRTAEGPCVALRIKREWHIFVESRLSPAQRRFAVAREIGHLCLCHATQPLAPGVRCFVSRESAGDVLADPQELDSYTADLFAIRLLAPACLLHELGVTTPSAIQGLCGLPPMAAAQRAERLELLNQRDAYYTHFLEIRVRDAFRPFLLLRQGTLDPAPAVRLQTASAAAYPPEIHDTLPSGPPPWDEKAVPAPVPTPAAPAPAAPSVSEAAAPKAVLAAINPAAPSRREGWKAEAVFFFHRNRGKLFRWLAVALGLALLFWLGSRIG